MISRAMSGAVDQSPPAAISGNVHQRPSITSPRRLWPGVARASSESASGWKKATAAHRQRVEDEALRQRREVFARDVDQQLLQHGVAAAGIPPAASRLEIDAYRWTIRGRHSVERLQQRRRRASRWVNAHGTIGQAGRVAQHMAERHRVRRGERVVGNPPRAEHVVNRAVERQDALIHETQHGQRGHRLADRRDLKQRRVADPRAARQRPGQSIAPHHGDRHAGHSIELHPLGERHAERWRGGNPHRVGQAVLHEVRIAAGNAGCVGARARASGEQSDGVD